MFKLISTTTVGAGGTSAISFTSIPQTYKDLMIVASLYGAGSYSSVNGNSSGYGNKALVYFDAYPVRNYTNLSNLTDKWSTFSVSGTANFFGVTTLYIPDYANTSYNKSSQTLVFAHDSNSTSNYAYSIQMVNNSWSGTSAITSFNIADGGTIAQYSKVSLYGIA